ncbi:translesion error-prone DNA polymerase V autoproteolytic subunit [Acinetobacter sp. IK40]|jgi:DNA polymerase V|uniref:LexA family protein n=1 Tax=Acinetobacter sp. IK40 TaxID=2928897 RepID=UPI002D1E602B|nr:translesion error-prone DNA polymerase V autoproteolytic subunit [Acinetobacter sp. IK40]MEB3790453.1 translesion error-prone DNA polymerase V autoproteolytic subunit [Acinetobacter sp. IK40]
MSSSSQIIEIKNHFRREYFSDIGSISLIEPSMRMQISVAIEKVSAGFPSPAQDYIDKKIDMNEHLIQNECATFIVKVASLSMINAGIDIDDELIVDRSLEAKHRDIIVALVDNDFTVKRLMIDETGIWLKAENPEYSNIYLNDGQQLELWGVVTFVLKNTRKS